MEKIQPLVKANEIVVTMTKKQISEDILLCCYIMISLYFFHSQPFVKRQ